MSVTARTAICQKWHATHRLHGTVFASATCVADVVDNGTCVGRVPARKVHG